MVIRLGAILVVVIVGIATGWVAGFSLHQLVSTGSRTTPPPGSASSPSPAPAPAQAQTDDPGPPGSGKPDVIIGIPGHDAAGRERHHYLSLGQIIRGIDRIGHGKKKHHEGKEHDDRDRD